MILQNKYVEEGKLIQKSFNKMM